MPSCHNKLQIKKEVKQQLFIKKLIFKFHGTKREIILQYKNSDTVCWTAVTGVSLTSSKGHGTGPVTLNRITAGKNCSKKPYLEIKAVRIQNTIKRILTHYSVNISKTLCNICRFTDIKG